MTIAKTNVALIKHSTFSIPPSHARKTSPKNYHFNRKHEKIYALYTSLCRSVFFFKFKKNFNHVEFVRESLASCIIHAFQKKIKKEIQKEKNSWKRETENQSSTSRCQRLLLVNKTNPRWPHAKAGPRQIFQVSR